MPDEDDIDDFIKEGASFQDPADKYRQFRGRRGQELKMWEQWNQGGRKPEDLEPLLSSIEPMIAREARKRVAGLGGRIPETTLKNELRNHAVTALQKYDPNKGAQLSTHIHQNFFRITDFIATNRNTRRMPRNKVERYQEFENAKNEFKNQMGRDPTTLELQQMFPSWPKNQVQQMERGFGSEVFSDMGTPLEGDVAQEDAVRGAFLMTKSMMNLEEQQLGDMLFPPTGKRPMSVKAIARAMKIPEHKAYRIKTRVEQKMGPILRNR